MASIVSVDARLQALLPPAAKIRLSRLIAAAEDAESSFRSHIARQERLREEIGQLEALRAQSIARARELGDDQKSAGAEFDGAINDLQGELARLFRDRQRREDRRTNDQQVVAQVRAFLERQSTTPNTALIAVTASVPKYHGQTVIEAITRIRAEITAAQQELAALRRAPLPSGELRQKAKNYIAELAKAGRPLLMAERGEFRIDWMPGVLANGPLGPAAAALLAAVDPDRLYALLEEQINHVVGAGLSENERPRRQQQIEDRILALERSEEALVEQAHENDHDVARRPAASPFAILSIKIGTAQRLAAAS